MKILFITQYFPPEIEIGGTKIFEISNQLKKHNIIPTILTAYPNFPTGNIFPGFNNNEINREKINDIEVIRIPIYPNHSTSLVGRLINQISFLISGIFVIKKLTQFEIIFATSPPLTVGLLGFIIAKVKQTPFIFEVRDLWPESAIQVGLIKRSWFTATINNLQSYLAYKSNCTIALTNGVRDGLKKEAKNKTRGNLNISVIRNGVDTFLFKPNNKTQKKRNNLKVGYIGTLSLIHGVEIIIKTALLLKDYNIEFHIIGDGVERQKIIRMIKKEKINNVFIHDPVPKPEVPKVINNIDIGLVTVKNLKFCEGTVPAKMFEYWACAKPIILAVKGEAEEIAKQAKGAICIQPENAHEMFMAIIKLKDDKKLRLRLGKNGRKHVQNNSSILLMTNKYLKSFRKVLENESYI